jgi:hypothetical protein
MAAFAGRFNEPSDVGTPDTEGRDILFTLTTYSVRVKLAGLKLSQLWLIG